MERFVIEETTNTLVKCNHHMPPERLDYLVIPHQYKGKQVDRIEPHCFDGLVIPLLCIEYGVEYLEERACENAYILNVKLPRGLKIGKRCSANSQLEEILLPKDLHIIKEETFLNCKNLKSILVQVGLNTISCGAFCGCSSLKSLEIQDSFDKLEKCTFSDANALEPLSLWAYANSLYFRPDGFKDTCMREISLIGDFEPIVEKRSYFSKEIILKMHYGRRL